MPGLNGTDEAAALDKLRHIHAVLTRNQPACAVTTWRTWHAVTFHVGQIAVELGAAGGRCGTREAGREAADPVNHHCLRRVQVVLRLYKSVAEVLLGFDLDCCTFGYAAGKLWCLPRGRRAVNARANLVDPSRQSLTYEQRLLKYARRGFAIKVPSLEPVRLDASALLPTKDPWSLRGLGRLLGLIAQAQRERDAFRRKAEQLELEHYGRYRHYG